MPKKRGGKLPPATGVQEIFAVALCSTLALNELAYERFLAQSGVLHEAIAILGALALGDSQDVEIVRRQIQSLVMAAEVDFIVSGMMKGA